MNAIHDPVTQAPGPDTLIGLRYLLRAAQFMVNADEEAGEGRPRQDSNLGPSD